MNRIKQALHYRVAILVAAAALLSADTAFAFSTSCWTLAWLPEQCSTLAVRANESTHTVTMNINSSWTTYQMRDNGNQFIIREGSTGGGWHFETIGGLYNTAQGYILYCSGFAASCELNND